MAVYQRSGWWYARKTVKGVEYRQALGTRSKREAETAYNRWVADLEEEAKPSRKLRASFRKGVNLFTEHHLGTLSRNSQTRYLQSLLNLTPHFYGKDLPDIGRADLASYVSARRKTGVSDATIIRDLACLSSVFTIAIDWEEADINPVLPFLRQQKRRGALKEADPKTRYLDHREELLCLSRAAEAARDPAAIRVMEKWMIAGALVGYIDTGMRAQELLVFGRSWCNWNRMEITVPSDVAKSSKDRVIPILPRFARVLETLPVNKHTDLVFWRTESGRRFMDLNHTLQRYAYDVSVAHVTIHDLRRTCGCRLLQDYKMPMKGVSEWLGHASVEMTERAYAFLKVENLHEAVGTRRSAEDLRPRLDAVLLDAPGKIAARLGTPSGTLEIDPTDVVKSFAYSAITHNP